jgi:hypothetical protein
VESFNNLGGGLGVVGFGKKDFARIQISNTRESDLRLDLWCGEIRATCFI